MHTHYNVTISDSDITLNRLMLSISDLIINSFNLVNSVSSVTPDIYATILCAYLPHAYYIPSLVSSARSCLVFNNLINCFSI